MTTGVRCLGIAGIRLIGVDWVSSAPAQARVAIPDGVLRGTITDTIRRMPLSYALVTVIGADRRAFATEAGRSSAATWSMTPAVIGLRCR